MKFQICAKCKKRPAMVFITRLENGNSINEGICLSCASELGIRPVNDMLKKMGIDDEAIQNMSQELDGIMESGLIESDDGEDGAKIPTLNLGELFGMPMNPMQPDNSKKQKKGAGKNGAKDDTKKLLSTYCTNLNEKASEGKIDRIVGRDREIERLIQSPALEKPPLSRSLL